MFKEAIGALSSSLVGAVKSTASEYTPTAQNMGGAFTRIAQQGIANLSYRSPILADMAATMLHTFQQELVHRENIRQHIKTPEASEFHDEVKTRLGEDAKDSAVESEMIKIIQKMEKIVDKEGSKAKDIKFYQENEKFYKQFLAKITPSKQAPQQNGGGLSPEVLAKIEANTATTAQLLAHIDGNSDVLTRSGSTQTHQASSPSETPKQASGSFVDPYTGLPSIRAAIGGIGGQFLSKVFDDATLDKFAGKARRKLGFETAPEVATPKKRDDITDLSAPTVPVKTMAREKPTHEQSVSSILKDVSLDLTDIGPKANVEDSREDSSVKQKQHNENKDIQTASLEQLKTLNAITKAKEESNGGILGSLKEMVSNFLPLVSTLTPIISGVGTALMSIAPIVAVAGAAFGVKSLQENQEAEMVKRGDTQSLSQSIRMSMPDADEETIQAAIDEKIKVKPTAKAASIEKAEAMIETKNKQSVNSDNANPTLINSTTNNSSNTTVVLGNKVRNEETTFERVQSSNFWAPF